MSQPVPTSSAPPAGIHALLSEYDNALSCIRCGLCLSVCPTYQLTMAEEEGPRGRIAMARGTTKIARRAVPAAGELMADDVSIGSV